MTRSHRRLWLAWGALTLMLVAGFGFAFSARDDQATQWRGRVRAWLLPGATTHGHYQIELNCDACHGKAFASADALQDACMRCHGVELKEARDSHPKSKFTDPRNADRAARLDATRCVTCHVEHRPGLVAKAGSTLPRDYCAICHDDIAKDRPSHKGLGFSTCGNSGCHNFHDNRALYEDFLVKHAGEPAVLPKAELPKRDFGAVIGELGSYPIDRYPLVPLSVAAADGQRGRQDAGLLRDWLESAHAQNGVNCSACHLDKSADGSTHWNDKPSQAACKGCHEGEVATWLAGKHGMRMAANLPPMRPGMARQSMRADAASRHLDCIACHGAHRFDLRRAATESCSACHADQHTRNYAASKHAVLWRKEQSGELPAGQGVSCASCHMPRIEHRTDDVKRVLVQHNQNDTLRPSDKMLRPVCLNCHGMQFSLDALADGELVARNFQGLPKAQIGSVRMAKEAEARAEASRKSARKTDGDS